MGKDVKVVTNRTILAAPSASATVAPARFGWRFFAIGALLACATFAVYWQTTRFPLINFDDPMYVTDNPNVRAGLSWATVRWAFNLGYSGNWFPLTWISHMADCQFFGMTSGDLRGTGGHHLMNVLLHIASSLLLFGLLHKLTRQIWASAFVAALFALHPLRVESVAWVAERKDVLSVFFLMLTFCAYAAWARAEGVGRKALAYLLVIVFYGCGLMSKQTLVSAPILFLFLDYWPLERASLNRRMVGPLREKIPFILMAIGGGIVVIIAQGRVGAISQRTPLADRICNAIVTYVIYLGDIFWPHNLAHVYPHEGNSWGASHVFGSLVLLAVITTATILARSRRYLLIGWFWYLVTLVPVIGLVQTGEQARADRFTYIPSIGIFMMVAFGASALLKHLLTRDWTPQTRRAIQVGVAAIALMATGSLAIAAHRQAGYWQSDEKLCKHTLAVTRNNWLVHSLFAAILNSEAQKLRANGKYNDANIKNEEAMEHAKATLTIMPEMANAHVSLANALYELNRLNEAADAYRNALRFDPDNAMAHSGFANCLKQQGKFSDALAEYEAAVRCEATRADLHYNYGLALMDAGRSDDALSQFKTALNCFPSDLAAYWTECQMASIYLDQGRKNDAIPLLRNAVSINEQSHVDPSGNSAQTLLQRIETSR